MCPSVLSVLSSKIFQDCRTVGLCVFWDCVSPGPFKIYRTVGLCGLLLKEIVTCTNLHRKESLYDTTTAINDGYIDNTRNLKPQGL